MPEDSGAGARTEDSGDVELPSEFSISLLSALTWTPIMRDPPQILPSLLRPSQAWTDAEFPPSSLCWTPHLLDAGFRVPPDPEGHPQQSPLALNHKSTHGTKSLPRISHPAVAVGETQPTGIFAEQFSFHPTFISSQQGRAAKSLLFHSIPATA